MPTVVFEDREPVEVDAPPDAQALRLAPGDLARATGWELKPEGACRGEECVPLAAPGPASGILGEDGRFDLAAFARLRGQPVIHDDATGAWAFGEPQPPGATPAPGAADPPTAPDFRLPDLDGRLHALSDYRGHKVLLVSWASW